MGLDGKIFPALLLEPSISTTLAAERVKEVVVELRGGEILEKTSR